jgi:diguanylate cyclase (GGDEF)-like protein
VARLGGDEFAVLMSPPCIREDADRHAARMVQAISEPFQIEEHRLRIGCSIGVNFVSNQPDLGTKRNGDMLLHQADLALYRAKEDGRRAHRFFEPSMGRAPVVERAMA